MIAGIDLQRAGGRFKSLRYADGTVIPGFARRCNICREQPTGWDVGAR
jgi:hypothetical protein